MYTDFEQATTDLATAVYIVERHDQTRGKAVELRADCEIAKLSPNAGADVAKIKSTIETVNVQLDAVRARVCQLTNLPSFEAFSDIVAKAKTQLTIVIQYRERVDMQSFYLHIYKTTGVGPQFLEDGMVYDEAAELEKLAKIQTQFDCAMATFIHTAKTLSLGPLSSILLA